MSVFLLVLAGLLAAGGLFLIARGREPGEGWGGASLVVIAALTASDALLATPLLAEAPARRLVAITAHLALVLTGLYFSLTFIAGWSDAATRAWAWWGALPALAAAGMLLQPPPPAPAHSGGSCGQGMAGWGPPLPWARPAWPP